MTPIVKFDPARPEEAFSRCKDVISSGGVLVYPTDTFYGLGADPKNPASVKRLFEIKARQADQPILLLIDDAAEVRNWAREITGETERLMRAFWPGPLTLVFKARQDVLPALTAGTKTIGLRMPGNSLTRQLLAFLGSPLTGTSANRSGDPSPETAEEALAMLQGMVDMVLDTGRSQGGKPSTILDVTGTDMKVIREGAIPAKTLFG